MGIRLNLASQKLNESAYKICKKLTTNGLAQIDINDRLAFSSVKEQICEQASYTLHHLNRAKLFTENSAMARLRDILKGWGSAFPCGIRRHMDFGVKAVDWCLRPLLHFVVTS